jgi:hypothetical protein
MGTSVVDGATVLDTTRVVGLFGTIPLPGKVVVGKMAAFFWNKAVEVVASDDPELPQDTKVIAAATKAPRLKTLERTEVLHSLNQ